jgi:hypothetical protein
MHRIARARSRDWHASCLVRSEPALLQLNMPTFLATTFWRTNMTKLMIADLSVAQELDRREMSAVRGGLGLWPIYYPTPSVKVDTTNFMAEQVIGQTNSIMNNTGNEVALVTGIHSSTSPVQQAHNTINF